MEKIKEYASGVGGVNAKLVDRKFASMVRDAELLLHVYTVNEKEQMVQLLEWGCNRPFYELP
ncbi:glycerophosphodiester phosphodiesterase family protein [Gracilibacillus sp. JCM 18860]|uniref:glycerophosphodiester phosphodiesterase family protein n=1 Tax=Gracilibacillus sp. JCM 18860 TaxID=1306159 RepID=UPI0006CF25DD